MRPSLATVTSVGSSPTSVATCPSVAKLSLLKVDPSPAIVVMIPVVSILRIRPFPRSAMY
jgi:hypothetical protein